MAAHPSADDLTLPAAGGVWTAAELRRGRIAFAVLAIAAFAFLIWLGLGMTFFADEWAFIESRSLADPATWWAPHNEHWATLQIVLYRAMVEIVGIGSYVPYLVGVAILHLVVAGLVHGLLERTSGPLVAVAGGAIILLFGSGFENVYWGFQIGFLGSLAFGLAAMLVTDRGPTRRRAALVATLLLASLATQGGIGAIMGVAVGLEWLMDARWRRWLPMLALPAGVFAAWYLLVGRSGTVVFRDPLSSSALLDVSPSILRGFSNAFGSVTGLPVLGLFVAAALATWGSRRFARDGIQPRAVAALLAIAVQYALIGAARGGLFDGAIDYTRYTYVSGVLALIAFGSMLGPVRLPASGRPRLIAVFVLGSWVALAMVVNVGMLVLGREIFLERGQMTRALVTVALEDPPAEGAQLDRSLVLVPSPISLRSIVARYGDPRTDALVPRAVRPIPPDALTEARRRLVEGAPIPGLSDGPSEPEGQ